MYDALKEALVSSVPQSTVAFVCSSALKNRVIAVHHNSPHFRSTHPSFGNYLQRFPAPVRVRLVAVNGLFSGNLPSWPTGL